MAFFPRLFRLSSTSTRSYRLFVEGLARSVWDVMGSSGTRQWFQDFMASLTGTMEGITSTIAQGGTLADSTVGINNVDRAVGVVAIGTGTTNADGRSGLSTSVSLQMLGNQQATFETKLICSQSEALQEYSLIVGFGTNFRLATLNAVRCAYFRYHRAVDGDFWACICAKASDADPTNPTNTTKVVTTVPVNFSNMQVLRIVVTEDNVAYFYINGAQVAVISTNVPGDPSGLGNAVGIGARVLKSVGTGTTKAAFIDYFRLINGAA